MDNKQIFFPFFLLSCCLVVSVFGMTDRECFDSKSCATESRAAECVQRQRQLTYNERNDLNRALKDALKTRYGFNTYSFFDNYDKTAPLTEIINLLDRGATSNSGGCTPLHLAASYGDVALVYELLKRGSDTHVRDAQDNTPVLVAAWQVYSHYRSTFSPAEYSYIIDYCRVLCALWNKSTDNDKRYFIDRYDKKYLTEAEGYDRLYYVRGALGMFREIFGYAIEDYDPLDHFDGT